jgi:7,8-dihydropterin-6-yl-methyl-4-(beta-D-ribofuranosyl)aminobenzene 5'-phosphate synthase
MTMEALPPVDALEVLVVVDNLTDSLSTTPSGVRTEFAGLLTPGRIRPLSGRTICCASHGLSLLVTARIGDSASSVLFDAGPDADVFLRNAALLDVDFAAIDAIVLSHGHWDHAGGLSAAVGRVAAARRGATPPCYLHPDMFDDRGVRRADGAVLEFEPVPDAEALAAQGGQPVVTRSPQRVAGGRFHVSGEIPRRTAYEVGFPGHVRRGPDGSWQPDPLIVDERFLAVRVRDRGLVVFSACSHAGVVNVLEHARASFPQVPLYGLFGGLHLAGPTEAVIPQTVADVAGFDLRLVAPGHCTGWRATAALAGAFGERLVPLSVGKRYLL